MKNALSSALSQIKHKELSEVEVFHLLDIMDDDEARAFNYHLEQAVRYARIYHKQETAGTASNNTRQRINEYTTLWHENGLQLKINNGVGKSCNYYPNPIMMIASVRSNYKDRFPSLHKLWLTFTPTWKIIEEIFQSVKNDTIYKNKSKSFHKGDECEPFMSDNVYPLEPKRCFEGCEYCLKYTNDPTWDQYAYFGDEVLLVP